MERRGFGYMHDACWYGLRCKCEGRHNGFACWVRCWRPDPRNMQSRTIFIQHNRQMPQHSKHSSAAQHSAARRTQRGTQAGLCCLGGQAVHRNQGVPAREERGGSKFAFKAYLA